MIFWTDSVTGRTCQNRFISTGGTANVAKCPGVHDIGCAGSFDHHQYQRYHDFIPCHSTIDALGLAKLLERGVPCLYKLPSSIISDQGPQFASLFWGQLCHHPGIKQRILTAFQPLINGLTKQLNASMDQSLCVFLIYQQPDWVNGQLMAEMPANNSFSEPTKCIPFVIGQVTNPRVMFLDIVKCTLHLGHINPDGVQSKMIQIHTHLHVER